MDGASIFDCDPLTLDFPALALHFLPPPPTLYQSTPLPNSASWSILPPDDQQYEALRSHFSSEFRKWRVSCAIATTSRPDDLSYPPPPTLFTNLDDPTEIAQRAEADAKELEAKICDHLHQVFVHWNSFPVLQRTEIWTLELARSVGRKSEEVQRLKREKELSQQETAHLKLQVDELSRLQHPREFRLAAPTTLPIDSKLMAELGEVGIKSTSVGWSLLDRNEHLDKSVERAIGRWKGVVKEARGAGTNSAGLAAERSLNGDLSTSFQAQQAQNHTRTITSQHNAHRLSPIKPNSLPNSNSNMRTDSPMTNGTADVGIDQDLDADAEMDEEDAFVETTAAGRRAPEAPMAQAASFRLGNGIEEDRKSGMEGLEHQTCIAGYVRIGA